MRKDEADMARLAVLAARYDLSLTPAQLDQFVRYQALLIEWSRRVNLTSIVEPKLIQERHFLDSLACATIMGNLNGLHLADVGTGAGFPGLPLKILFPQLNLTLIESVRKKTRFLQVVVEHLGLSGVKILAERVEVLGQQAAHREKYDWVTARAVAELRVLVEYLLPLCRLEGYVLAQKGPSATVESADAAVAIKKLGGSPPELHAIRLPGRAELGYMVVIKKMVRSPARYPRRPGVPVKRPL